MTTRTTRFLALLTLGALTSIASANVVTKTIPYEHNGTKLEGFLAWDDAAPADVKRPGVLVVHEWWGLNDYIKDRARQLAGMGYVAFALDMYGAGMATTEASKAKELAGPFYGKPIMAERAKAGLDQLLKTGLVNERQIAAIGFCFGGSTCQALAFSGAPVAAIVSFHGGLLVPTGEQAKATRAKLLILNGAVDPMVKSEDIQAFMKALEDGKVDYQFINYSGARHAFTNQNADKVAADNNMTAAVGYNEVAARRSWAQMKSFFDEVFGKP